MEVDEQITVEDNAEETEEFFKELNDSRETRAHIRAMTNVETDNEPAITTSRRSSLTPIPAQEKLDGGWGWMVVFGCAFMHFLFGGFERSFGVVYVQLLDRFEISATVAAVMGGMFTTFRFGLG